MALTMGEAQAVGDLLGFLFRSSCDPVRALNGAEFLASQARQVRAGIRPEEIQAGWRRFERSVTLDAVVRTEIDALHRAGQLTAVAVARLHAALLPAGNTVPTGGR